MRIDKAIVMFAEERGLELSLVPKSVRSYIYALRGVFRAVLEDEVQSLTIEHLRPLLATQRRTVGDNTYATRLGVSVFLFDYRGYGRSEGQVSEKGTYRDAEAALAYLESRQDVDQEKIVFFGRSLGCAVAVDLASRHPPYALILESPFTSISDMAKRVVPLLLIGALLRTKYNSLSKISGISAPLLVLHGDRDEVVPIESGQQLYQAANEPKKFYTIPDAGHNDTYIVGGEEYFAALRQFLAGLVEKTSQ